jgi:hypothetical protein
MSCLSEGMKEKEAYGIHVVGSSLASGANNVEGVAVKMEGVLFRRFCEPQNKD